MYGYYNCEEFLKGAFEIPWKYVTHATVGFIYNIEIVKGIRFDSSNAFLKHPEETYQVSRFIYNVVILWILILYEV